eukprot:10577701-Prorocentrum_lima.AAC.1
MGGRLQGVEPAAGGQVCLRRCNAVDEKYMRFMMYVHEERLVVGAAEATGWMHQAAACPPLRMFAQCPRSARGSG